MKDIKKIEEFCETQQPKLLDSLSKITRKLFIRYALLSISRNKGNTKLAHVIVKHYASYISECQEFKEIIGLESYVKGLRIINNYISPEEEKLLLSNINKDSWNTALKRRTQHYGYEYNYNRTGLSEAPKIPDYINVVINKIMKDKLMPKTPDQVIINEYDPGQGIGDHIDDPKLFGSHVVGLSLGSQCCMVFTYGNYKLSFLLPRRSLLIFKNDARYLWKHGIVARKSDDIPKRTKRSTRVSVTFRTVL